MMAFYDCNCGVGWCGNLYTGEPHDVNCPFRKSIRRSGPINVESADQRDPTSGLTGERGTLADYLRP